MATRSGKNGNKADSALEALLGSCTAIGWAYWFTT